MAGALSMNAVAGIAPWETGSVETGSLQTLAVTLKNSFFSGSRFFAKIASNSSLMPALIYGMLFGSVGTCATALWNAFPLLPPDTLFSNSGIFDDLSNTVSAWSLIASPIILLTQLFFSTVFVHGSLFITGSRKKAFLFSFKTMCYAQGAMLFQILPLVGPLLAALGWIYLTVSGIRFTHDISLKRTLLALLLPVLLLMTALAMVSVMAIMAAGLVGGTQIDPFSLFKQR
jgi:hypothetical protein